MKKSRSLRFHEFGPPEKVLRLEDAEERDPGPGEVLVRMEAAPINPADLNLIEGSYGVQPPLPAISGIEGAGVVESVGPGAGDIREGQRVLLPHGIGTWREFAAVPAEGLTVVPPEIPAGQAAMLKVNPPTAWRMLHDFATLRPGDWVIQNAANSGVGRAAIVFAQALGLHTVNVVRRESLAPELSSLGADAVLVESEELPGQVREIVGGGQLRLGLNSVGGESALRLAKSLATGGILVTFGAMGRQPLRIPNGMLIFKNLVFTGFWISKWYRQAAPEEVREMFSRIFPMVAHGRLHVPVAATYPLESFAQAIAHASGESRGGKVQFALSQPAR